MIEDKIELGNTPNEAVQRVLGKLCEIENEDEEQEVAKINFGKDKIQIKSKII